MHYFMLRISRPHTGTTISLLAGFPLFNEENGRMFSEEEIAYNINYCAEAARFGLFRGWEVNVGKATQENIDEFEEFLAICGE